MSGHLQSLFADLTPEENRNPFTFIKWKRGRPNKEALLYRKLYHDWIEWNKIKYPKYWKQFNRNPLLDFLMKNKRKVTKNKNGQVMIRYKQRQIDLER